MFRATMCPSSGEITISMRHLVFVTLCAWLSGMQGALWTPDSHAHRVTNTKCRADTVISPDDGHIVVRNLYRKEINILRKTVHQVGFIYKIIKYQFTSLYRWFPNIGVELHVLHIGHFVHQSSAIRLLYIITYVRNRFCLSAVGLLYLPAM